MRLTEEEFDSIDWNDFSLDEINTLIDLGYVNEHDMQCYYGNRQWRDAV